MSHARGPAQALAHRAPPPRAARPRRARTAAAGGGGGSGRRALALRLAAAAAGASLAPPGGAGAGAARAAVAFGESEGAADGETSALVARAALEQVRGSLASLEALRDALAVGLQRGAEPDARKLVRRLKTGDIGSLRRVSVTLDSYVGPQPLDEIDKAVWGSMPDPNSGRDATRRPAVPLPWLERPNALVCALVSCVDAPNQLASTDAVMSLKMLTDGADYVARGDRRASYDSLLLNFEDTVEKLRTYVRFAEGELERRSGASA